MIKFGKKVTYHPLFISLFIGILIGSIFGLNISRTLGIQVGGILFVMIMLGHYLFVLPIIFNYWESNNFFIRYNDIKPLHNRLLALLLPHHTPIKAISKKDIKRVSIIGLPQRSSSLTSELILSEEGGFMYNLFLMINEPVKVRLTMNDNSIVDLDISRDYVKKPEQTLAKLHIFLKEFSYNTLNIPTEVRKIIDAQIKEDYDDFSKSP